MSLRSLIKVLSVIITSFSYSQQKEVISVYQKGEKICNENRSDFFCKAYTFFKNKQYDSCYIYSKKAILKSTNNKERDYLYYILGYSSYDRGLYNTALESFSSISNEKYYKLKRLSIEGDIFLSQKKYDRAILNFKKWISTNAIKDNPNERVVYHNLGLCYIHIKDYLTAEKCFKKELSLIRVKDTSSIIRAKMELANIYYNQYLDNKAIPLFKEAYHLAKNFSNIEFKHNTSKNMAIVERNRKRYKESVAYFDEYVKWKDSIWNRDKIWELTEKDKQLAVAQKQQEIVLRDEQIKRQKIVQNGLLLGASGLLVFIGGLGYFYRKLKKQKQLITEQKEELDVANKTKNYLFSVVSHDLRSPINTIKRQHKKLAKHIANNDLSAIKEANQQAISVTDSTSHLLNNVLQWSLEQSNQLNFSQEDYALQPIIEHILFDYEEVAESNDISIATNFTEDITVKTDKESLKIVLRNLIDNSIKYMNGTGDITITTTAQNNQARIEIKDSGIGISEEKLQKINALKDLSVDKIDRSKGVGLGLILCQTLIKKNNGTLFFESIEGKSTTAIVLLPLA